MKKRHQKKALKKQYQQAIKGQSKKELKKLKYRELEKKAKPIIQQKETEKKRDAYISFWSRPEVKKEQQKIYKRTYTRDLHRKKVLMLEEMGFDRTLLSQAVTKKIPLKDIENKNITRQKYPDLYPENRLNETQKRIDYSKRFKAKPNKDGEPRAFYFAYLDLSGEIDLEDLVAKAKSMSNKQLIQSIVTLLKTNPSYSRSNKSPSSGKAGVYKYYFSTVKLIKLFHRKQVKAVNKSYRRIDGTNARVYQQLWNSEKGCNYFEELSIRGILEIMYVFMDNITELNRFAFHSDFYADIFNYLDMTEDERQKLMRVIPSPDLADWR